MSTKNDKNKIKKPIINDENFIDDEKNDKSIVFLVIGIVLVVGLIIGIIAYLNNSNKIEEADENEKNPIKEVEKEKKEEKEGIDEVVNEKALAKVQPVAHEITKYTVEFYKGEELLSIKEVNAGTNVSELTIQVGEKEKFKYWYQIVNDQEKIFDFTSEVITSNIKLYAKIVDLYTVEFKNIEEENISEKQILESGSLIQEIEEEDLVIENEGLYKKILNWYLDKDYVEEFDITKTNVTSNLVLYGKYSDVHRIRFYFDSNLEYDFENVEYLDKYVLNETKVEAIVDLEKDNKVIKEWNILNEDTEPKTESLYDFNTLVEKNMILLPVYGYRLSYETNGGSDIKDVILLENDFLIEPDKPKKPGYAFDKWVNNLGEDINFLTDTITNHKTIYALWTTAVSFETNGGSIVEPIIPNENGEIENIPSNPIRAGYEFKGWYYDEEYTARVDFINDRFIVPKILYAKWDANENILTYDVNTGMNNDIEDNGANKTIIVKTDEVINLLDLTNKYTKEGYILLGYSTTSNGAVEYHLNEEYTMGSSNTTLYAVWGEIKTLTLDYNGGTSKTDETQNDKDIEVIVGDKILEEIEEESENINPPTESESIVGYNTAPDGTGEDITASTLMPNEPLTVYVQWDTVN